MNVSAQVKTLFAGILLVLCVGRLEAQGVVLVIDNSASMVASSDAGTREALRTVYRLLLTDALASRQGLASHRNLKIVPLGNRDGGALEIINGSDQSTVVSRVKEVFGFRDLFTHIERTLRDLEDSSLIGGAKRIVIISDMAPDHDNEEPLWSFNRQDILDLKETVAILGRWLENGKRLEIALLGWNEIPTYTGGWGGLGPYFNHLDGLSQVTSGRSKVEEGLALLRALYPAGIEYRAVSTNNIGEDFAFLLCDVLELRDRHLCPTVTRTDFLVRTVFDGAFNFRPYDLDWYESSRAETMYCGGKRNLKYRYQEYLDPGGSGLQGDIQFEVRAKGDADAYRKAEVKARIVKPDQSIEDQVRDSQRELGRELDSRKTVLRWVSRVVAEELCALINRYYPPPETRKSFVLVDYEGRRLSPGMKFGVKMHFAGSEPPNWSEKGRVRRDGFVQVLLRRDLTRGEAYLLWREPGRQGQNRELSLKSISPADVQNRFPLSIRIPRDRFVDCRMSSTASADLHVVRRDGTEETTVKVVPLDDGTGIWNVPVLPGSYYWEAVPAIDRNLLASYVASVDVTQDECVESLDPKVDPLREGQDVGPRFEQFVGEAKDSDLLERSSWFFWALFRHTSEVLVPGGAGGEARLTELWTTIFRLVFGTEENPSAPAVKRRIAYRGLPGIGLEEESDIHLLRAAMNRFLRRGDSLAGGDRARYRDWLASVEGIGPDYPVSEALAHRLRLD